MILSKTHISSKIVWKYKIWNNYKNKNNNVKNSNKTNTNDNL